MIQIIYLGAALSLYLIFPAPRRIDTEITPCTTVIKGDYLYGKHHQNLSLPPVRQSRCLAA